MTSLHPCRLAFAVVLLLGLGHGISPVSAQKPDDKKAPELKLSEEEQAVLDLTNEERKKADLPALKANAKLFKAARDHSANMAKKQELNHVLDGKTPLDRIRAVGYRERYAGENINEGARTPAHALKIWLDSPPHKENLLKKEYTEIGIGYAKADNGKAYYTQVFAAPK